MVFCIERIIIIFFPLKAKGILTLKSEVFAIIGTALICCLLASLRLPYLGKLGMHERTVLFTRLLLVTMNKYVFSTIVLLILTLILCVKIIKISNEREQQFGSHMRRGRSRAAAESSVSSKEFQIAIIFLMMSAVQTLIYIFCGATWGLYYLSYIFGLFPDEVNNQIATYGNFADYLTLIVRSWNFFVYFSRIPSFRNAIITYVKCGRVPVTQT